jgi:catechol 2,3-dioxygenase
MEIKIQKKMLINAIIIFLSIISLITILLLVMYSKTSADIADQDQTVQMGAVSLDVVDLELMKDYYMNAFGLEELASDKDYVELGFDNKKLVILNQNTDLEYAPLEEAGLYHMAMVFSTQESLANTLENALNEYPQLYQGSSDHLATEAFYFSDPEGNGVEIYYDKPREEWSYDQNGKPRMGSIYLDENEYIRNHKNENSSEFKINMGHIHLKVGNINIAKKFYSDTLLFDIMNTRPDSLFVARDNYHHHLGMNTWQSAGANLRADGLTGLDYFEIIYTENDVFNQVVNNIKNSEYSFEEVSKDEFIVSDPWGTKVRIMNN